MSQYSPSASRSIVFFRRIIVVLVSVFLSGCLLKLSTGHGGNVHFVNEQGTLCDPCDVNTASADGEAYFAVSDPGYEFSHWDGATGFCTIKDNVCMVPFVEPTDIPDFDNFIFEISAVLLKKIHEYTQLYQMLTQGLVPATIIVVRC